MSFIRKIKTEVIRSENGNALYLISRYVDNGEIVCKLNFKNKEKVVNHLEVPEIKVAGVSLSSAKKDLEGGLVPVPEDFFKSSVNTMHLSRFIEIPFPIVIPEDIKEALKLQFQQRRITKEEYKIHLDYIKAHAKMVKRQAAAKKKQDKLNSKFINDIFKKRK